MARAGGGVNALYVFTVAAGGYLVWSGIRNVPVIGGLRELSQGRVPTEGPQKVSPGLVVASAAAGGVAAGAAAVAGGGNAAIAAAARKYLGKPYVFGAVGPNAFDCSGLVVYILRHDFGMSVPRLTTATFPTWSGARTIDRSQIAAGDLVIWTAGHMGIAISPTRMIHAPSAGRNVQEANIWWTPRPIVRRVVLDQRVAVGVGAASPQRAKPRG